ncbi:conserved hypothetical protein [Tenacibaculum amylolyticum]
MPLGYVANNNDQCPETDGKGSATGCILGGLSDENFVYSITPQIATDSTSTLTQTADAIRNVIYYDGLGRAKQSIAIQQSPSEKDVVSYMEYDAYGRQAKEYLPYASINTNGAINTNPKSAIVNYYKTNYTDDFIEITNDNEINAYSEKLLEASPLNRVLQQAAPGKDWKLGNGHEIKFEHISNGVDEVRLFGVTTTEANGVYQPTLTGGNGFYLQGELYKTINKDENWTATDGKDHTTEEFKNKQGQVVLKRTYNENEPHDTYYVYDDFGNLTYVLPPKVTTIDGVSDTELSELCYQYKYDYRNRLVEKKIAGKAWEYVVYDNLDRHVLTQDANLRAQNKWLFTKYDKLGRTIYTGLYTHTTEIDQPAMQALFNSNNDSVTAYYETKTTSEGSLNDYTNTNFPSANVEVLTVNYYDTYTFDKAGATTTVNAYGIDATNRIEGLVTGTKIKVLDTNDWITTVTFYDEKARPIYVYTHNAFLGTTDRVASRLDFVGRVEETTTTHQKTGKADIVIIDTFQYDHTGRLLSQQQKINEQPVETIVSNSYDALGQLSSKKVGGDLQTVNYAYNIRGWLKKINEDANNDNDLFNFEITYNNPSSGVALYNGNIAQTSWQTANLDNSKKTYSYAYDPLNRITAATGKTISNYDLSGIMYDKNGNVLSIKRNGHLNTEATSFGVMDDLVYSYDNGNKLIKVVDNGNDGYGFKDSTSNTNDDYSYDLNGNMISDANKGISNISYNHLNLPTNIVIGGKTIVYTYDAVGMKLRKIIENITTDYANGYVYENDELQFFNHTEGYVKPEHTGFSYIYQHKDHLDNVRLSYTDTNKDGIVTQSEIIQEKHYYPFGMIQKGYNNNVSSNGNSLAQNFSYNGKELNEELGLNWLDFGARNYDASLGRWMNVDSKADAIGQIQSTPYAYALNKPINLTDPDGDCPPGINCENVLPEMERMRVNRASNLGAGYTRNNGTKWHAGHDLYAEAGTSVRSSMAGTVHKVGTSSSYGNYVTVKTTHTDHVPTGEFTTRSDGTIIPETKKVTRTYYTFYAHLESTNVEEGASVTAGQQVGTVGTTGNASGLTGNNVHLHFEIGTELRSTNSPFLKKSKLLDANIAYKDVFFKSEDEDGNQSVKGTVRISKDKDGNIIFTFQNFKNTTENGKNQTRLISNQRKNELLNGTGFE